MKNTHLPKGTVLQGKYTIIKVLGQGGFGITYLAQQAGLQKPVAIKEFFFAELCERDYSGLNVTVPSSGKQEMISKMRRKFLKEARLISSLDYSGIVRVTDVFDQYDTSYYVMEYIDGESLGEIIKRDGPMAEDVALGVINDVADALIYLHRQHINHLDIKPANIMIERHTGRVVIIDFGVSKQYDSPTGDTTTSTPLGVSNGYSPIEQYNSGSMKQFSPGYDIYSLGATLYKMVTGQTPPTAIEISQDGPPELPENLDSGIANAITEAMQPRLADRPQSVEEFLDILDNVQPKPRKKTMMVVLLCIAVAALAFTATLVILNNVSGHVEFGSAVDTDTVTSKQLPVEEIEEVNTNVSTQNFRKQSGESYLSIDYPTECSNPVLLNNIREKINEILGGRYKGSLDDGEALFRHYFDNLETDTGYGEFEKVSIKKDYEDEKIITFIYDIQIYGGGAHGSEITYGITFRKSDGKQFSINMIQNWSELQPIAKAGLRKYFDVSNNEELFESLMYNGKEYANPSDFSLPIPTCDPWIDMKGVHFIYREYEIAGYAGGTPTFVVPISQIRPYLNSTGLTFIE